jgi:hypothetical protein
MRASTTNGARIDRPHPCQQRPAGAGDADYLATPVFRAGKPFDISGLGQPRGQPRHVILRKQHPLFKLEGPELFGFRPFEFEQCVIP